MENDASEGADDVGVELGEVAEVLRDSIGGWNLGPTSVAAVASVVLLVFILRQIRSTGVQVRRDHERRSAEFTLQFLRLVSQSSSRVRAELRQWTNNGTSISESEAQRLVDAFDGEDSAEEDKRCLKSVQDYLNELERLAVGIKLGVLDEAIVWYVFGDVIRNVEPRAGEFIKAVQTQHDNASWVDLMAMVDRMNYLYERLGDEPAPRRGVIGAPRAADRRRVKFARWLAEKLQGDEL